MIEPTLRCQLKIDLENPRKFTKDILAMPHEFFNSVNIKLTVCKFIVPLLNSVILFITQVNLTVIAFPPIGADSPLKGYLAADHFL